MTRRDLAGWRSGVADAIDRLEREAECYRNTNVPHAHAMDDAIAILSRLRPSRSDKSDPVEPAEEQRGRRRGPNFPPVPSSTHVRRQTDDARPSDSNRGLNLIWTERHYDGEWCASIYWMQTPDWPGQGTAPIAYGAIALADDEQSAVRQLCDDLGLPYPGAR